MENANGSDQSKPGDINIFLFSNGQVYSPPRKYHLKATELKIWDSTKNYLARSHFGYLHSTIDLYTIDGKKIESPSELVDKNAYVAVEIGEEFMPGGYDQYLMKASKSWYKRYGETITHTPSKERVQTSEKTKNSSLLEKVHVTDDSAALLTTVETVEASENKKSTETPVNTTASQRNSTSIKQTEKRKTSSQRSSILRRNSAQPNDKKPSTPLPTKRKTSSPPKKISISKTPSKTADNPQTSREKKDSQQLKTILSPAKTRHISSQFAFDTILSATTTTTNVTPAYIVPAKLSIKNGIQKDSIVTGNLAEVPEHVNVIKPAVSSSNDVKQEFPKPEFDSGQKVFETLESIVENVNSHSNNNVQPTKYCTDSKVIEPFTTSMNVGDVINLRLSIELKNNTTDTHITKKANVTVPVNNNNKYWNEPTEKSSQVNMDEIGPRNETMKNILNDLNKNEITQKYVIFYCDCCHNNLHENAKRPKDMVNEGMKNINNKDYVVILPSTKHNDDNLGCKCDDEFPKLDKNVQTSFVIENVECLNVAPTTTNVDQSIHSNKTSFDVKNVLQRHSDSSLSKPYLSGKSAILHDISVTPPNESRTLCTTKLGCSDSLKDNDAGKSKIPLMKITNNIPLTKNINNQCPIECTSMPKGNYICPNDDKNTYTQINHCANILQKTNMLDKFTQTDCHSLLLEARRQTDGHFSFHLPPLHMVKLCQKKENKN